MVGLFFLWLMLAVLVGVYAGNKGHSGFGMFLVSLILSPLIGFLIEAVRSPNTKEIESASLLTGHMKKCPACAELIKSEARKCRYCGEALEPKQAEEQVTAAPEERRGGPSALWINR